MPFAPFITTIAVAAAFTVAAMPAATAQRGIMVPYDRRSVPFKSIVSNHRPPSSGQRCRTGQRWEHPCRVCVCTAKGILRCEALPCNPTGKNPLVEDEMVIPPHMTMRDRGAYMNHRFHLKSGDSAEEVYKTLAPDIIGSTEDSARDSVSSSDSREAEDIFSEEIGDYLHGDSSSFAEKSDMPDLKYNRSPPVHLLPDPDLDVICNYWLQNNKLQARSGGDYNFDEEKSPSAEYSGGIEFRRYQNQHRPAPVHQLPEPTIDELCRKWLETQSSRGTYGLPPNAGFLQIMQAANADTYPTSWSAHSPPRNINKDQPLPFLRGNLQADLSPLNQQPFYYYPPDHPFSYNPYPLFPKPQSCCGFDSEAPPSSPLIHRSPGGELDHFRLPPTPPQLVPPFTAPPPPAPAPPPPTPPVACDEDPPKTVAREVRDLHPEILDLNNANHFKMHPNAVSVPVRRRRSAADDGGTADYSRKQLPQEPQQNRISAGFPARRSSQKQPRQTFQDLEISRIVLPVARET